MIPTVTRSISQSMAGRFSGCRLPVRPTLSRMEEGLESGKQERRASLYAGLAREIMQAGSKAKIRIRY